MSTATLSKRCSPLTRPIGPDKVNVSVTVKLWVSSFFDKMAKAWRMQRNPMLRIFIVSGAIAERHPQAQELRHAMGVPSVFDNTSAPVKAAIINREMATLRGSESPVAFELYFREFGK